MVCNDYGEVPECFLRVEVHRGVPFGLNALFE